MIRAHIIIPAIDLITILAPISASGDYEVTFTGDSTPSVPGQLRYGIENASGTIFFSQTAFTADMPAYYLTTKAINCTYLLKTRLKFWRWRNVERRSHDEATIQISNDGSLWNTIWTNSDSLWTTDSSWSQ